VTSSYIRGTELDLAEINQLLRRIPDADRAYEAAADLWDELGPPELDDALRLSLYLQWAAFTDWVELKPEEEQEASREMVRAAQEWLALDLTDDAGLDRYFDHWLYEVLRYTRGRTKRHDTDC
jgi:LmbE family N-acetylglucosaminyl deacetylase